MWIPLTGTMRLLRLRMYWMRCIPETFPRKSMRPITCRQPRESLQVLFHHWDIRKTRRKRDISWLTMRQHQLSGKSSSGRWMVMGLTSYPENWNDSRFPARHGGTGNGDSVPITQNGKRKTLKMGNMYGMNPIWNPCWWIPFTVVTWLPRKGTTVSRLAIREIKLRRTGSQSGIPTKQSFRRMYLIWYRQRWKAGNARQNRENTACLPDYSAVQSVAVH